MVSGAGGSKKSKWTKSSMPSFFRVSTTTPRLDLRISGYVCSVSSVVNAFSVYKRKHFPGRVRPARPARCAAEALDTGETSKDSTRIRGLYTFCFAKPGSTTYTMPSMVMEVSAMFVATTTFLPGAAPGNLGPGAGSKIFCCSWGGNEEYNGTATSSPFSGKRELSFRSCRQACSISSSPVRNRRTSPSGSEL
eukprot:Skav221160  [mRNA]  locus=scaffold85:148155:154619:+ [translate_table: standard]